MKLNTKKTEGKIGTKKEMSDTLHRHERLIMELRQIVSDMPTTTSLCNKLSLCHFPDDFASKEPHITCEVHPCKFCQPTEKPMEEKVTLKDVKDAWVDFGKKAGVIEYKQKLIKRIRKMRIKSIIHDDMWAERFNDCLDEVEAVIKE